MSLTKSTCSPHFLTLKFFCGSLEKLETIRFSHVSFTVVQEILCSFTQKKVPWENMYQIFLWRALKFKQIFTKNVGFMSISIQNFVGQNHLTHLFTLITELIIPYASMKHFVFHDSIVGVADHLIVGARAHVLRLVRAQFQKVPSD